MDSLDGLALARLLETLLTREALEMLETTVRDLPPWVPSSADSQSVSVLVSSSSSALSPICAFVIEESQSLLSMKSKQ